MRPDPRTWSALEYACHTRDGFVLYETRIGVVLIEDRPLLPRMRRDEVVVERDYNGQNPAAVAEELAVAGEAHGIECAGELGACGGAGQPG
jgi:hypothetical protein